MKRYLVHFLLPFLGLAAICLLNSLIFHKFLGRGWRGYLDWYISAGPFIGLAQVAFAISWQALDKNTDLVSSDPLKYIGSCFWLVGLPINAFGGHLKAKNYHRVNPWDVIVAMPLIIMFVLAAFAWLLLIAPPQYFLFLVCGAPSRVALNSNYRLRAELADNILKFVEPKPDEPEPKTGWDASMRDKPVTMANAFGAVVLFLVGYLQGA
jgi:hypothetical protein